jgi:hypothetical protein
LAGTESRLLRWLRLPQGARGELLLALGGLLAGAVLIPCLIWVVGRAVLGPYTHGSMLALLADYYAGLAHGSPAFWVVLLGPYVLLQLARIGRRLVG